MSFGSITYLTLLDEEEILSDLLIKAFNLSICILSSSSPFEVNIVYNKKTMTIEDLEFGSMFLCERNQESNSKLSENTRGSQEEVYFLLLIRLCKFDNFIKIANRNLKTHFIEINNKKLIACLKLYSEKQEKFKDCNDLNITECLNKSIKKLVFFTSLVILHELVKLKVGF